MQSIFFICLLSSLHTYAQDLGLLSSYYLSLNRAMYLLNNEKDPQRDRTGVHCSCNFFLNIHSLSLLFFLTWSVCSLGLCIAGCCDSQKKPCYMISTLSSNLSNIPPPPAPHKLAGSKEIRRACHTQLFPSPSCFEIWILNGVFTVASPFPVACPHP